MTFMLLVNGAGGVQIFSPASGCTVEQAVALLPTGADYQVVTDSAIPDLIGVEGRLAQAKAARAAEVETIVVTTASGKVFDGNEAAQGRMARAVVAMGDNDTTLWVLADNTPATVTRDELREALRLAGEAQTAIWVKPYQPAEPA